MNISCTGISESQYLKSPYPWTLVGLTKLATDSGTYPFHGIRSVSIVLNISETEVHPHAGKTKNKYMLANRLKELQKKKGSHGNIKTRFENKTLSTGQFFLKGKFIVKYVANRKDLGHFWLG